MASRTQHYHVVFACFVRWTIDALDFFIMIFVLGDIAREFGTRLDETFSEIEKLGSQVLAQKPPQNK
jgi:hypothetical protein